MEEVKKPSTTPKVSQADFDEFKKSVDAGFTAILDKLDTSAVAAPSVTAPVTAVTDEAGPKTELTPVPPTWRELVVKILGPDFECEFEQPPQGGQKFSIIVPKEKSNADQQHWLNFARDKRTKELSNTGITGVETWCKKVRANLLAANKTLVQYP